MSRHDDVLEKYVRSEKSPGGGWRLNFPVGFSLEDDAEITIGATKAIDALCIVSRAYDLPDEYTFGQSGVEIVGSDRLVRPRHYRQMWKNGEFTGETVTLVEVKSGKPTMEGVGQLTTYESLFRDDWDADVDSLVLVCTESDAQVESACATQGIKVVYC